MRTRVYIYGGVVSYIRRGVWGARAIRVMFREIAAGSFNDDGEIKDFF